MQSVGAKPFEDISRISYLGKLKTKSFASRTILFTGKVKSKWCNFFLHAKFVLETHFLQLFFHPCNRFRLIEINLIQFSAHNDNSSCHSKIYTIRRIYTPKFIEKPKSLFWRCHISWMTTLEQEATELTYKDTYYGPCLLVKPCRSTNRWYFDDHILDTNR